MPYFGIEPSHHSHYPDIRASALLCENDSAINLYSDTSYPSGAHVQDFPTDVSSVADSESYHSTDTLTTKGYLSKPALSISGNIHDATSVRHSSLGSGDNSPNQGEKTASSKEQTSITQACGVTDDDSTLPEPNHPIRTSLNPAYESLEGKCLGMRTHLAGIHQQLEPKSFVERLAPSYLIRKALIGRKEIHNIVSDIDRMTSLAENLGYAAHQAKLYGEVTELDNSAAQFILEDNALNVPTVPKPSVLSRAVFIGSSLGVVIWSAISSILPVPALIAAFPALAVFPYILGGIAFLVTAKSNIRLFIAQIRAEDHQALKEACTSIIKDISRIEKKMFSRVNQVNQRLDRLSERLDSLDSLNENTKNLNIGMAAIIDFLGIEAKGKSPESVSNQKNLTTTSTASNTDKSEATAENTDTGADKNLNETNSKFKEVLNINRRA